MMVLGENYDEYVGLDEYDAYDPFEGGVECNKQMNYLELVDFLMDEYGLDEDTACREADAQLNPNYNADDYDA